MARKGGVTSGGRSISPNPPQNPPFIRNARNPTRPCLRVRSNVAARLLRQGRSLKPGGILELFVLVARLEPKWHTDSHRGIKTSNRLPRMREFF